MSRLLFQGVEGETDASDEQTSLRSSSRKETVDVDCGTPKTVRRSR